MQSAEMNPTATNPNENLSSQNQPRAARRVTWIAATRGDYLLLGPVFMAFKRRQERGVAHWLMDSGEVGMAACQARDWLGLTPDETAELCHPADEPALRLSLMLERSESFIRRRKGSHVIFSGFGPTAAATAIYCHARGCHGLWLRPPDPAGLAGRLRWEAGLERMIRASAPCVEVWQIPGSPDFRAMMAAPEAGAPPLEAELPGLRPGAPLVIIAVLRRDWGYMDDATSQVAKAAAAWAKARPQTDFLIISNLNARLEGPVRSLPERPANLLLAPPLPYPVYNAALERAALVLTDAPLIVAEAMGRGVAVAMLGDLAPDRAAGAGYGAALTPGDLASEAWAREMKALLDKAESGDRAAAETAVKFGDIHGLLRERVEEFLARAE